MKKIFFLWCLLVFVASCEQEKAQKKAAIDHSLMFAAQAASAADIQASLDKGANVNARDEDGYTPLMYAAWHSATVEPLRLLIDAGANIEAQAEGITALIIAAGLNPHPEITQFLIDAGANVNATAEHSGYTPFMVAVGANSNPEVVKLLLAIPEVNKNVKTKDLLNEEGILLSMPPGVTPLMIATVLEPQLKPVEKIKALLAHEEVNVNLQDSYGFTAFMYAVGVNPDPNITQAFLSKEGLKKNAQTTKLFEHASFVILPGTTALMIASTLEEDLNPIAKIRAMLADREIKANINTKNSYGFSAFMYAVGLNPAPEVTQLFLSTAGLEKNAQTTKLFEGGPASFFAPGTTALMIASTLEEDLNPIEKIRAMLADSEIKAQINMQDSYGFTALMYAVGLNPDPEVAKLLVSTQGINKNIQSTKTVEGAFLSGVTAFIIAATLSFELKPIEKLRALLDLEADAGSAGPIAVPYDIDVNIRDHYGLNAFTYSIKNPGVGNFLASTVDITVKTTRPITDEIIGDNLGITFPAGTTALMIAATLESANPTRAIVLYSILAAKINAQNNKGLSALMYAARYGHYFTVQRLLEVEGIQVDLRDNNRKTALALAKERAASREKNKIIELLKGAGATE